MSKYYSLWSEFNSIRNYKNLSDQEKNRLLNLLLEEETPSTYYADLLIHTVYGGMDKNNWLRVALNFIRNRKNAGGSNYVYDIISKSADLDLDKTKKALLESKSKSISKFMLSLSDLSLEEEIAGLRGLSTSRNAPNILYTKEYSPSPDALKKLPPVMRLNTLESLAAVSRISYNIFKNIEEDEFKALLFTVSLKHTDRVQKLSDKFAELKFVGIESTVQIDARCPRCKDYTVTIKSNVIRTKEGMYANNMGRLLSNTCPFCYGLLESGPNLIQI